MQTKSKKQKRKKKEDVQSVPANIMKPRILFLVTVFLLTLFGLVMIYSSSSVLALGSEQYGNNPNFFIKKQIISLGLAVILCAGVSAIDYRRIGLHAAYFLAFVSIGILLMTYIAGVKVLGASRWIVIPGIGLQLQPSEFVKPYIVLASAFIIKEIIETGSDPLGYAKDVLICVAVPVFLILLQPDKGTTIVIITTLLYMVAMTGMLDKKKIVIVLVSFLVFAVFAGLFSYLKGGYGAIRIKAFLNPWSYRDKEAYQIIQGYYAFASGGILGKGAGFSSQKYAYLPMAYNDFIYAIVGEEFGLIGTVGVLFAFYYFYKVCTQIADQAPDFYGKLIVMGSCVMIVSQFILNVVGVLGLFPSSGKPIPFISYGGSSIMGTYILVGMILNVSFRSKLPETRYDRRRNKLSVIESGQPMSHNDTGFRVVEGAGEPTPRKRRGRKNAQQAQDTSRSSRRSRTEQSSDRRSSRRSEGSNRRTAESSRSSRSSRSGQTSRSSRSSRGGRR